MTAWRPPEGVIPAAILVAAAYACGTLAAAIFGGPWSFTAAVATLLAVALALHEGRARALVFVLIVVAAGLGHARFVASELRPGPPLPLDTTVELIGVLRDDALVTGAVARADLDLRLLDGAPAEGGVRLVVRAPLRPLMAGDLLRVHGVLEPPPEVETFDYAAYLRSQGIYGFVAFPERWERVGREEGGVMASLRDLRRWASTNIERALPEPSSALAAGVLLGERRHMPADVEDDLRVTGTTHLVVVSGQNVALLLGSTIAILTLAIARRQAALLSLALLPGYVVLVAVDPPVVRAAIMAVGIVFASIWGRRTPGWLYLLYAVAIMLAVDPLLARNVAFQLSASATAGVMLVAPPLRDAVLARLPDGGGRAAPFIEVAAVATGATLAVVPVQAAAFERVSLIAVPANVLVAPLYEATVLVALLGALLGWLEPAAQVIALAGDLVPRAFLALVGALAAVRAAELPVTAPLAGGAAWYAALGAAVLWLSRRRAAPAGLEPGHRTGIERSVALGVLAGGLWLLVLSPSDDLASVTVLDVGQGLAVLVRDGGTAVLIDTGPPDGAVVAALSRVGPVRRLDAAILTHPDADHAGGLVPVERRLAVGAVLAHTRTLEALERHGIAGTAIDIGDRVHVGRRTVIEVLSPPVATASRAHRSANDASLVLLVSVGERRILMPADIEAPAEQWLVRAGYDLRAEVLVVPHHGSKSSSTPEFLAAVQPAVAVVSAGERNPYGHPAPEVLERYEGIWVLRTDEDGDITFRSDGNRLWLASSSGH